MALQRESHYMGCFCPCKVVPVVNVHVEFAATFKKKGNTPKVVLKQTDVLDTVLRAVEDSFVLFFFAFAVATLPIPPCMILHQQTNARHGRRQ